MTIEEAKSRIKAAGWRDIRIPEEEPTTIRLTRPDGSTLGVTIGVTPMEKALGRVVAKVEEIAVQKQMIANIITGGEQ